MLLRLGYPLTGDKRETTIAIVIVVAIIIQTTQNAQAFHRANGLAAVVVNVGQIYVIGGGREPGGLHTL